MSENEKLVEVQHLQQYFPAGGRGKHKKFIQAVDDVSFFINRGETLGLVGESGCGKTTVGRTLLRLYEPTDGKIIYDGNVIFDKENKVAVNMLPFRRKMQMVFQDPYASLDPRMTIGDIVGEPIDIHHLAANKAERREKIISLLERVGLNSEHANRYPHEFSGGQRQRIAVARALMTHPDLIVCDEPVSALDASVQAQILNLLRQVQEDFGPAYLFISHDLAVEGFMCPHILVMYLGRFVEEGPRERLLREPAHPYTRALLASVPSFEDLRDGKSPVRAPQQNIRGELPSPLDPPSGCRFHPRCPQATERCREEAPQWKELELGWRVRCHLYG